MTDDEWLAALQGNDEKRTQGEWNEAQALREAVLALDVNQPIDQFKKQRVINEMRRLSLLDTPTSNVTKRNNRIVSRLRERLPGPAAITSIAAGLVAVVFMVPYFGNTPEIQNPVDGSGNDVKFRGRPVQLVFETSEPLSLGKKWQQELASKGIVSTVDKNENEAVLKMSLESGELLNFLEWWGADQARITAQPLAPDAFPPSGQIWITLKAK